MQSRAGPTSHSVRSISALHKPLDNRVQYQKVVEDIGEIENADIVKGYEDDTDTYIAIDPDDTAPEWRFATCGVQVDP